MKTVQFAILAMLLLPLALQAAPDNRLKGISVEENTEGTLITIEGSGTPTFSAFRLQDPPRLLVDIAGAEVTGRQGTVEVYNGVVAQVGTIAFGSGDKKTVRVIVTFEKDSPLRRARRGSTVADSGGW